MILICVVFSGCANSGSTSDSASSQSSKSSTVSSSNVAKTTGETQTLNGISITVPAGMSLKSGSLIDEDDTNSVMLEDSNSLVKYIVITKDDEKSVDKSLEWSKEICDNPTDCTLSLSSGTFTGFSYEQYETKFTELKGSLLSSDFVEILASSYDSNDEELKTVLNSIKISK